MPDILTLNLRPASDAVESRVGDETVLLHLGSGTYYGLDRIGTEIWEGLKSGKLLPEICAGLADRYGQALVSIEADVRSFLLDLQQHDILRAE